MEVDGGNAGEANSKKSRSNISDSAISSSAPAPKSLYDTRSKNASSKPSRGKRESPRTAVSGKDPFGENMYKSWSIPKLPDGPGGIKSLSKSKVKSDLREIRETLQDGMLEDDDSLGFMCKAKYSKVLLGKRISSESDKGNVTSSSKGGSSSSSGNRAGTSTGIRADVGTGSFVSSTALSFNQGRGHGSTGTGYNVASNNFYYPFKKMKEWEELKDYLEFVNQQAFNSMRNVCVEKIEVLRVQRDNDLRALQAMEETYREQLRCTANAADVVDSSNALMQSALGAVCFSQESATLLRKENDELRNRLAELEEANTARNGVSLNKGGKARTGNNKQRKNSTSADASPMVAFAPAASKVANVLSLPSGVVGEDEDDDLSQAIAVAHELRCVNTCFGLGVVHGIRVTKQRQYSLVVKLEWGATAFLQLNTLTTASLHSAAGMTGRPDDQGKNLSPACRKRANDVEILKREVGMLVPPPKEKEEVSCFRKAAFEALANMEEDVEQEYNTKDRPVLFSRTDFGAPRGVVLDMSIVSSDPSFALPPASASCLDPDRLRALYKEHNVLLSGCVTSDARTASGNDLEAERAEEANADYDLKSLRRDDRLSKLVFNWGGPDATPFADEVTCLDLQRDGSTITSGISSRAACGLHCSDLKAWEAERREFAMLKGNYVRLESEAVKLRRDVRHRDKRLTEAQKSTQYTMLRADEARAECALWKQKCSQLLNIDPKDSAALVMVKAQMIELQESNSAPNSVNGSAKSGDMKRNIAGVAPRRTQRQMTVATADQLTSAAGSSGDTGSTTGSEREGDDEDGDKPSSQEDEEGNNIDNDDTGSSGGSARNNARKRKASAPVTENDDEDVTNSFDDELFKNKRRASTASSRASTRRGDSNGGDDSSAVRGMAGTSKTKRTRFPPSPDHRQRVSSRRR